MAFNPGKNVGRVSIRVVPDTKGFRQDLKRQLDQIAKTTDSSIKIDKVRLDKTKIRESVRRQLEVIDDVAADAVVKVTVDGAKIRRGKLRKSIQEQFDAMGDVRVWIKPGIRKDDQEIFHREVKRMIDRAKGTINVGVAAHTAAAAAQLRYTTRPRWVDIFVRINKASLVKAVGTLAALSGARLTWKWIDDLAERMRNLDKTLPSLLNWTSGITALIAALAGTVSGLVGIGQGLFTITPAFLVIPGLILNAIGSLTVLIVALKHSREELGALSADMNELGAIIRTTFWDNARRPIIDLVRGLMPQLRNSFRELSQGVGEFTGALANAFGQELANGRLEGIFAGIAEGWRILGSGASGFAGALVSLSEIAAKYTPRLAGWFVRQANTFDAWLTAIATDRRLDRWMETAIDSMYDLWDATTGTAGVLANIWRAADQAGSAGLAGFADMMQEWRRVTGTERFQNGLAAVFRGSYVAMDAFGRAIGALGDLIGDMPDQFERFVGSVGGFLGGVFEEAFKALNNVNVAIGLDGFSAGLESALSGITPALGPIAETFGNFLGLLGDLAANLLPTAAGAFAALMPVVDELILAIKPVLPVLGDAVTEIVESLAPALIDFTKNAAPVLAQALVDLTPVLAALVQLLGPILQAIGGLFQLSGFLQKFNPLNPSNIASGNPFQNWTPQSFIDEIDKVNLSDTWFADLLPDRVETRDLGLKLGRDTTSGISEGIDTGAPAVTGAVERVRKGIAGGFNPDALVASGENLISGLARGIHNKAWLVASAAISAADGAMVKLNAHLGIQSPSKKWEKEVGHWLPAGIARGIDRGAHLIEKSAVAAVDFDPFGSTAGGAPRLGAGNTINVTQPLLPGETPQEQRDNLVRELQWAL